MLGDCITKPLLIPASVKHCAAMGMIGIGLQMVSGFDLGIGLEMASICKVIFRGIESEFE